MKNPADDKKSPNLTQKQIQLEEKERYTSGWRTGKPVEDPSRLKSWGYITARPSEYLVVVSGGKLDHARSGQGARVFKWPWDSVAVVPTTIQKLEFVADQITRERVGVRVTGIAVYRVAEPELAYRMLNFSFSERASEKLATTLGEMFIGAARRLIANLTLDECLMKRKESIATFLMQEIAPVVSGRGAESDQTDRGWGVVLDTIEIQDVLILSKQVFEDLQAPFRHALASQAQLAELERQRQVAEQEAREALARLEREKTLEVELSRAEEDKQQRDAALALGQLARDKARELERIRLEEEKRKLEAATLLATLEREKARELERIRLEEERRILESETTLKALARDKARELERIRLGEEKRQAEATAELARLTQEQALLAERQRVDQTRLEQQREEALYSQETTLAVDARRRQAEGDQRRLEVELRRLEQVVAEDHARVMAEIEQLSVQGRVLHELVTVGLPQLAQAFKQNFGTIHVTQLGASSPEGGPLGMVAGGLGQVLAVARSFGLDPARLMAGLGEKAAGAETAEVPDASAEASSPPDAAQANAATGG